MFRRFSSTFAVAFIALGCHGGESCEPTDINREIRSLLREWHLYPSQLSARSPSDFEHPTDFLRAMVENVDLLPGDDAREPDDYSVIVPLERFRALEEGVHEIFGFRPSIASTAAGDRLFVSDVFGQYPGEPPTPASEAGIERGFQIQAMNGVDVPDLLQFHDEATVEVRLRELLEGDDLALDLLDRGGHRIPRQVLRRASVETRSVATSRVLGVSGRKVGYLHLRDFLPGGAFEQLHGVFADFTAEGVRSLVVDLRYNRGGNGRVAEFLGNLIAGSDAEGELFLRYVFSSRKRHNDRAVLLTADPCPQSVDCAGRRSSLRDVEHVVVLATNATASAAEVALSGLEPHVPVTVIGSRTFGKPVGTIAFPLCTWALMPVTFGFETALGPATNFDGIPPACEVDEDLARPFGDPDEAMLAAALHFIDTGACPEAPPASGGQTLGPVRFIGRGVFNLLVDGTCPGSPGSCAL